MATPEPIVNDYLAHELRSKHPEWLRDGIVIAENTASFASKGQRPDIIVCDDWAAPVGVETEYQPAMTVEKDAASRLGQVYTPTGGKIHAVVAVRLPSRYRNLNGSAIANALRVEKELEYCLLTGDNPVGYHRWPSTGFVKASVANLASVIVSAKVSSALIDTAATILENGARMVASQIEASAVSHIGIGVSIADTLKQEAGFQTYAMTATILINAFVFQETLAGASHELLTVTSLYKLGQVAMKPTKGEVIAAWDHILSINYWPIFGVARKLVEDIPPALWSQVRDICIGTADQLLSMNLGKNPDLVGTIFQRLISDRKFLATFYTAPSSAALMARLLVSDTPPNGVSWGDVEKVQALRVADFACGTGSLLCAVYSAMQMRLEHAGINSADMHRSMVEKTLVGCDVLPSATYITASQLSSAHPTVQYGGTNILTLPFGQTASGGIALGALDLLDTQGVMPTIATHATGVGATSLVETDTWSAVGGAAVGDASFDIVAMNPPFTRLTGGGGKSSEVSRPLFAAFGTDEATQAKMGKKAQKLLADTAYHGNAGAAAAFVEIGNRKLKTGGKLGLILPLSALSGASWAECRRVWRRHYEGLITFSIAADDKHAAFSADTGMAESMIVGTKALTPSDRLTSVSLYRRPESTLEGAEIARVVKDLIASATVRRIEDGPVGGTDIMMGGEKVGELVSAPTAPDPWPLSRIRDHSIAQTAYQLSIGAIWLPGSLEPNLVNAPICRLDQLGEPGPYHLDISGGGTSGGAPRGPFELRATNKPASVSFPVMKAHDESRERYLEIDPDAEGVVRGSPEASVRAIIDARAKAIWATRTRLHFATDVQFNSNALIACLTSRPAIGGRAWPSFRMSDPRFEQVIALWFNSTLGILSFWWSANKTQDGRGSVTTSRLGELVSIDPRTFDEMALAEADQFFDTFKGRSLMDVHEASFDEARAELDEFVAKHLLNAGTRLQEVTDGLRLLRSKLVIEPSIRGARRN
ncbi:hypothetical protein [Novosphingobium sp.]|uniref:hypothetical protein n=1 Tax=Novosphingobium sp. TaxID=1874826 RepID=UPI00261AFE81|nr:hypothetical protein [Novosphingobium sp.]